MNDLPLLDDDFLPVKLAARLDEACDRFEQAWKQAIAVEHRPTIEPFVESGPSVDLETLIRELVQLDIHYRREVGETPKADDYLSRFPDLDIDWNAEIACRDVDPAASSTSLVDSRSTLPFTTVTPSKVGTASSGGARIAHFELLSELGRGGMGVVYRARDVNAKRIVALKIVRPDLLNSMTSADRQQWLLRFRTEAQAAARIDHDHAVTVYEVGEDHGSPFYSMRYVEGRSLAEYLHDGPLPNVQAVALLEPIARAIHTGHEMKILHRDLKPRNILVGDDRAYVMDFGLAKLLEGPSEMTATGQCLGTPSYIAPEQAEDAASATVASDIYGIGAVLYATVTGRPPFQAATVADTLHQVKFQEPVSPRRLNPTVDRDLETICLKCLEKDPNKRYATAARLADDLHRFSEGLPLEARPVSRPERVWRWCRRKPVIAGLMAALFLTLLAGVSGVVWQWQRAELKSVQLENEQAETLSEFRRAEVNFERAMLALDFASREVGDLQLTDVPQAELVREAILERALQLHEGFLKDQGTNPRAQWEAVKSYRRVGHIRENLGHGPEALEAFQKAVYNCQQLCKSQPDHIEYRQALARSWVDVGNLHVAAERFEEAEAAYQQAQEQMKTLPEDIRNSVEFLRAQASFRHNEAILLNGAKRFGEAEATIREAITIMENLQNHVPGGDEYLEWLANAHNTLAIALKNTQQHSDAEVAFKVAIGALEEVVRNSPRSSGYRARLGTTYRNLARFCRQTGRADQAESNYALAAEIFEQLSNDFPRVPGFKVELAQTLLGLSQTLPPGPDNFPVCRDLLVKAVQCADEAVQASPDSPAFRRTLRSCLLNLSLVHTELGEHQDAVSTAAAMSQLAESSLDYIMAARILLTSISLAQMDLHMPMKDRESSVQSYVTELAAVIRDGLNRGLLRPDEVERDEVLQPLFSYSEIKAILEKSED